jgi:hypothetical protein
VLTPAALAERIAALPDVAVVVADESSGAPEGSWGDRFCFVGPDRRRPFATIVEHDTPGYDEDSRLDRPGVYRLNIDIGRQHFEQEFGYPPSALADHRATIDFSQIDTLLPHPVYGGQGWASVLTPGTGRLADIDRLLAHAHRRAAARRDRSPATRVHDATIERGAP